MVLGQSEEEIQQGFYDLYETPHEGYKLYAVESVNDASDDVRRLGQRAASGNTTYALFSEKEAKQRYPEIIERLLRKVEE